MKQLSIFILNTKMDGTCSRTLLIIGQQSHNLAIAGIEALFIFAAADLRKHTNRRDTVAIFSAVAIVFAFLGILCRGNPKTSVERVMEDIEQASGQQVDESIAEYLVCHILIAKISFSVSILAVIVLLLELASAVTDEIGSTYVYIYYPLGILCTTVIGCIFVGSFKANLTRTRSSSRL